MGGSQSKSFIVLGYEDTYIDFDDGWSKEGSSRRVYRGKFRGDSHLQGKLGVVKVYKELYSLDPTKLFSSDRPEPTWEADDRAYRKAADIAKGFNAAYQTSKPIEFIKPEFCEIDPRTAIDSLGFKGCPNIPEKCTVAVERYLDEQLYVKFSNNTGYVNPKHMATPAAFSHYSYHITDGEILVCDLQGLRTATSYKLTDPAIHSGTTKYEYGPNDWGKFGIVKFFMNHECNALCEGLKKPQMAIDCTAGQLEEFNKVVGNMPEGASTAPTYMLEESWGISRAKFEEIQEKIKVTAAQT